MGATKSEAGAGVVEGGAQPGGRGVALRAGLREADLDMVGVLGAVEIFQMATDAVGRRALVLSAHVAGRTVEAGVGAGERKARQGAMVKASAGPGVGRMALLALRREAKRRVAECLGVQVRTHVAADAVGGQALKLPGGAPLMARIAISDGVRADQREPVGVVAHRFQRYHPAVHGMAPLALRSHLAAVNVGMAVGALASDVGEHGVAVALHAGHVFVHATQGIARFVVVEFWNAPDRLPSGKRVTVLAGNAEIAVRAVRGRRRGLTLRLSATHCR